MNALFSRHKANTIFASLTIVGMILLYMSGHWWPEIFLPLGIGLLVKQYLRAHLYDMFLTAVVFGGAYLTLRFPTLWHVLAPILFSTGSLYLLFREFTKKRTEAEKEEELNKEIEESRS